MEVSILSSSWNFKISPKASPSRTTKLTETYPISLKIRYNNPIRAYKARPLNCKSVVAEDFIERSSPIEASSLLDCTTWSGAGPGLMDAVTKGALEAKKPVGGIKIEKEAGEWTASKFHPYLPPQNYHTCRFFSARKHGLVDAVIRNKVSDKTAIIALPGGIGTLDEMFEILTLIQLKRIGSVLPVPFIVMNYDSFYSKLFEFMESCENLGTVSKGEVSALWKVCNNNFEALNYLAEFYDLPGPYSSANPEAEVTRSVCG